MGPKRILVALAMLLPVAQLAAQPAPTARAEIEGLIKALGDSRCEFNRNGSWYGAAKAREHLQRKYDYLLRRDMVASAEQFIERAASRSSMSGAAYLVRCPDVPQQPAASWFSKQLRGLRGSSKPVP